MCVYVCVCERVLKARDQTHVYLQTTIAISRMKQQSQLLLIQSQSNECCKLCATHAEMQRVDSALTQLTLSRIALSANIGFRRTCERHEIRPIIQRIKFISCTFLLCPNLVQLQKENRSCLLTPCFCSCTHFMCPKKKYQSASLETSS